MNDGLFVALYLDEDVNVLVGELLARQGFRALTTRDAGQLGKPDSDQLAFAVKEGLTILTHNRVDFEELHRQYIMANHIHAGIIVAVRRRPYEIAARLLQLLNGITADETRNQLLYT